jgi:CopG family transcriptional regulator, nickel-responsive regulator
MGLLRTGVAIDSDLLKRFDRFISNEGYSNRSEALRDLIRDRLNDASLKASDVFVVGTITLIYDHHSRLLPEKLMDLQHDYHELILSTVHAHLDRDMCLEVVVVKGNIKRVKELAGRLIGITGVLHGKVVMSSPGAYITQSDKQASAHRRKHSHPHAH